MGVSKQKIVDASIEILNRDGANGLTMRTLANQLDIKAASLYWHIKNKNELYCLLAEYLFQQIKMSADIDEPRKYLYEFCSKYRTQLLELRDAVEIASNSLPETPRRAEIANSIFECLSKIGVKDENLFTAANLLNNYILSFVAEEAKFRAASYGESESADGRFARWRSKSVFYYESQFLYGLEVLFAGFRAISPSK